ncbi:MAG TPA: polyprenyl synthetase family protein [Propioniciclava tarda]|nr:polyprenyl synthetase family protein [Propioniciclava tarda]SMO72457.1 heptaprenyl diphosphate synthase [Propioniciclava tarda]HOA88105.1 polyprenyl synthetase family protein [Propioniciclava tarda]HQA32088.1 polyprenyl synthetase family protein [Propioniciclava tarda]HQD59972.1 polyprenyl synthetase family protein [Propioniciclava tarda]
MSVQVNEFDPAFSALVSERLESIEARLLDAARADTPFVTEAASHIISAGGKRFRPLLVVLASQLLPGAASDRIDRAAIVMELTHVASLYHDDVMDEAAVRRSVDSANARWDNTVAILVGDYLFSRASSTVATLGTEYVALQAETFARLVQGQIAETRGPLPGVDRLQHYLDVVADKTGSLIAASARFGGMVCGASDEILDALGRYGEQIGVVFQLSDDIIDIASDTSGKTPGTDLREGVLTLPTLMVAASEDPGDARLRDLVSRPLTDEAEVAEALALLRAHPLLQEARDEVGRRAEAARAELDPLPDGVAKDALAALCDQVVSRSI